MSSERQQAYQQIVGPLLADRLTCVNHADNPATWICSVCEQAFCRHCMSYDPALEVLRCNACAQAEAVVRHRRRVTGIFRMPSFYVTAIVTITLIAYLSGATRPTPANLRTTDEGVPWQLQKAPGLWIRQAHRCMQRADYLRETDQAGDAFRWDQLALEAIHATRQQWAGQPLEPELLLAEARMLGRLERSGEGYRLLAEYPAFAGEESAIRLHYLTRRAELAYRGGLVDRAVADWSELLRVMQNVSAETDPGTALNDLIDLLTSGLPRMTLTLAVEELAGTNVPTAQLKARAVTFIREHGLTHHFAPHLLPVSTGESVPTDDGSGIHIERFEEQR